MTKVMVFGSFDGLHEGHLYYLKQAKAHGDRLVVVVARDETIRDIKGRLPELSLKERIRRLQELDCVDEVLPGGLGDKLLVIESVRPDVICLGYDQKSFTAGLRANLKSRGVSSNIIRIGAFHPDKYKSSLLKDHTSSK
ncbi:FAD synthase [Candidatus Woesearchaeota archaeon]|nr:FAD synthase [Candidatus Woesearchaeota archaeon]